MQSSKECQLMPRSFRLAGITAGLVLVAFGAGAILMGLAAPITPSPAL